MVPVCLAHERVGVQLPNDRPFDLCLCSGAAAAHTLAIGTAAGSQTSSLEDSHDVVMTFMMSGIPQREDV